MIVFEVFVQIMILISPTNSCIPTDYYFLKLFFTFYYFQSFPFRCLPSVSTFAVFVSFEISLSVFFLISCFSSSVTDNMFCFVWREFFFLFFLNNDIRRNCQCKAMRKIGLKHLVNAFQKFWWFTHSHTHLSILHR